MIHRNIAVGLEPMHRNKILNCKNNVVCSLLDDSPASEFYMPTFRDILFHLHRQVGACRINSAGDMFGVLYGKRFDSEMA